LAINLKSLIFFLVGNFCYFLLRELCDFFVKLCEKFLAQILNENFIFRIKILSVVIK